MPELTYLIGGGATFLVLLGVALYARQRRRREQRDTAALAQAQAERLHLPASLHPVIDPDVCIGSLSCISACPEGDILGIVDGAAKLIIGNNCIGHGRCATECPVDAIKLVFGTSTRGVDLPEIDEYFESSRPGVHIVGELGGMGLIKNAITQGLQVAERLKSVLPRAQNTADVDVLIVGAGPSGLATAVGCTAQRLRYRIVEQGTVGGTVAHFPRQKIVMTEKLTLPHFGKFGRSTMSKEDLLETWQRVIAKLKIPVETGVRVQGIDGDDGAFVVATSAGPIRARKVVLATGRRGTPRQLGVPGEDLAKVTYSLTDPEQYAGARTLVVGGGDSALEAAISVAEASDGEVALSYRGDGFDKCRQANRRRLQECVDGGKVHLLLGSEVQQIAGDHVLLKTEGGQLRLPNDYVIACLGGELPQAFLGSVGVAIKRHHGEARGVSKPKDGAKGHTHEPAAQKPSRLPFILVVIGILTIAGLTAAGWEYYLLGRMARLKSPLHASLKPSGMWGHGVGIAATLVMLSNFLYALRKRWGFLKGTAPIRSWLTWHMFVGFMSPVVILFHAAFQSNNLIATSTYVSLLIVVGTGVVGRFFYGLVPSAEGKTTELSMLRAQFERQRALIAPVLASAGSSGLGQRLRKLETPPPEGSSLIVYLLTRPFAWLGETFLLAGARKHFSDRAAYAEFREAVLALKRLRTQVGFYRSLRRLLSGWRMLHVVLAVFLVVVIAVHVGISLYFGYRWIF